MISYLLTSRAICVGSFALFIFDVIAAQITVGLCLFPISFCRKEAYFAGAVKEYSKRLGRYCRLEVIEVMDERTAENASGLRSSSESFKISGASPIEPPIINIIWLLP